MIIKLPNLSVSLFPKANFLSERRLYRYILSLGLAIPDPTECFETPEGKGFTAP